MSRSKLDQLEDIYKEVSDLWETLASLPKFDEMEDSQRIIVRQSLFTPFRNKIDELRVEIKFCDAAGLDEKYLGVKEATLWAESFGYPATGDQIYIGYSNQTEPSTRAEMDPNSKCYVAEFGLLTMSYSHRVETPNDCSEYEEVYQRASKAYFNRRKYDNEKEILEPFREEICDINKDLPFTQRLCFDEAVRLDKKYFGFTIHNLTYWCHAYGYPEVGSIVTSGCDTMKVVKHGLLTMAADTVNNDQNDDEYNNRITKQMIDNDVFDDHECVIIERA